MSAKGARKKITSMGIHRNHDWRGVARRSVTVSHEKQLFVLARH